MMLRYITRYEHITSIEFIALAVAFNNDIEVKYILYMILLYDIK